MIPVGLDGDFDPVVRSDVVRESMKPMPRRSRSCLIGAISYLAACGGSPTPSVTPRPLGRDIAVYLPAASDVGRRPRDSSIGPSTDSISLRDAVVLALQFNPGLAAFGWEVRAREARTGQAGRLPNPVLGVTAEDLGAPTVIQPQTTIQLSQLVELGGKRTARRTAAARDRDLAAWDFETARIEVLTVVNRAFVDLLAAQEGVTLTGRGTELAGQVQRSVAARVLAGVVSPIEETKADVAVATARLESDRAGHLLEAARLRLAATWGARVATSARAIGDLSAIPDLPAMATLTARLADNPDLARWAVEISRRQAAVAVERSKRVPDLTLIGGYRRFSDLGSDGYLIGVSLPLPLFDRTSGTVEAKNRLAKAHEERRGAEAHVAAALAEAYRAMASAHAEVAALRSVILPRAQQAFDAIAEGYRLGRFGYLDVLDAQRTLTGAQSQHLRAQADLHKARADIERLIGAPLNEATRK